MNQLASAISVMTAQDNDVDDVRWALSTAKVQWDRGVRTEAADWLQRAADAADAAGNFARAQELREGVRLLLGHNGVDQVNEAHSLSDIDIEVDVEDSFAPLADDGQFVSDEDIELLDDDLVTEIDDDDLHDAETIPPAAAASWASSRSALGMASSVPDEVADAVAVSDPTRADGMSSGPPPPSMHPAMVRSSAISSASASGAASDLGRSEQQGAVRSVMSSAPNLEFEEVSWDVAASEERTPAQALEVTPLRSDDVLSAAAPPGVSAPLSSAPVAAADPREGLHTLIDIDLDSIPRAAPPDPPNVLGEGSVTPSPIARSAASLSSMPLLEPLEDDAGGENLSFEDRSVEAAGVRDVSVGEPEAALLPSSNMEQPQSDTEAILDGVALGEVGGLEDLPQAAQEHLARTAQLSSFSDGEHVGAFSAALVTLGTVEVYCAASQNFSGVLANAGDVIFTQGTLKTSAPLRVVAKTGGARVATWQSEALAGELDACPWVEDELRFIADRYLGVCGATLGALGSRLDPSLRSRLLQALDVRVSKPGRVVVEASKPIDGFYVVGAGSVELSNNGAIEQVLSAGDFLFSTSVMSAAPAPATATVGSDGALLLYAPRAVVHELALSVPPLLEVLIG